MDFKGAFSSIMEGKEDKYIFWELIHEFWIDYRFCKENISFLSLIASIVFHNSIGVENYKYWTCEWNMRSGESISSKIVRIRLNKCKLCYYEPIYNPIVFPTLLSISKYTKCVSRQSSVLNVILNQAAPQWPWLLIHLRKNQKPFFYM